MEEQIRNRAYQLWQEAGSPEGDGVDFWLRAESDVLMENIPSIIQLTNEVPPFIFLDLLPTEEAGSVPASLTTPGVPTGKLKR